VRFDQLDSFADAWLAVFAQAVSSSGFEFYPPHKAGSKEEVSLEWWNGKRYLAAFVRGFDVEFLKISGPDVRGDMQQVDAMNRDAIVDAWAWIQNG
jgi:hypothetical protein